ncbi:MAG TPA: helix-turn-helix domain-containing protein [Gemmataceae bacterium]|nr:helix-turn-helix domain-containing protein [Gemmataceae bacterium]
MPLRKVLHEPGDAIRYVYFPCSGVVSVVIPPDGKGDGVEVGLVGREGVVGVPVVLGADSTPARWVVQVPGEALRMSADLVRIHAGRGPLHDLLLLYANAYLVQVCQSVACNALHPVEERLCRWLLGVHARVESDHFPLTHEFIAAMLGVRRASVTQAARGLQEAGLIRYGRGRLEVLDRPGLESAACGCHRIGQAELARLPGNGV